jgi:hypothetical protein
MGQLAMPGIDPKSQTQYGKFRDLSLSDKRMLIYASALMPVFWVRLKLQGFARVSDAVSGKPGKDQTKLSYTLEEMRSVGRLVNAAAAHTLGKNNCLIRSLVLQHLLSRRGIESTLRIGVRTQNGVLEAHAWIEKDGMPLNDRDDISESFEVFEEPISISAFS